MPQGPTSATPVPRSPAASSTVASRRCLLPASPPARSAAPPSLRCWPAARELWLLDEPHAGLDRAGRDLVDTLVRDAAAAGATVLFASHELDRAEGLATRTVTIAGGQVRDDSARPAAPIEVERAG